MKYLVSSVIAVITLSASCLSQNALAADKVVMLPLNVAMSANDAPSRLGSSVKFYFGKQVTPQIIEKFVSDQTSNRTNAFGKSNEKACNWVFLSSMIQLEKRARELGANAVINIVSNFNNIENSSETEFECHVGTIMAGVALKGDFVKISDK